MNIIYFPGFRSTSSSEKAVAIRKFCESNGHRFIPFEYPGTYDSKAIDFVANCFLYSLPNPNETILVGSSFGGWWALKLGAEWNLPALVINPSLHPSENSLAVYAHDGVVESFDGTKSFVITPSIVDAYSRLDCHPAKESSKTVFVCLDDEVLDVPKTIRELSGHAEIIELPTGGHSGNEHMSKYLDKLKETINLFGYENS